MAGYEGAASHDAVLEALLGPVAAAGFVVELQRCDRPVRERREEGRRREAAADPAEPVLLRTGGRGSGVLLSVSRGALFCSAKARAFLRGKGFITWCLHERCRVCCEARFAEGVGREGCSFAHIAHEPSRLAAEHLLRVHYPALLTMAGEEGREGVGGRGGGGGAPDVLSAIAEDVPYVAGRGGVSAVLSVVLTTSPTRSNPSTTLLEAVLSTFAKVPGLDQCQLVIVCDGHHVMDDSSENDAAAAGGAAAGVQKKSKLGYKRGVVSPEASDAYVQYKENVQKLAEARCAAGMPTSVIEQPERLGFGLAVRAALSQSVRTKYTMVVQHDRYFEQDIPIDAILHTLERGDPYHLIYLQNSSLRNHINKCMTRVGPLKAPDSWDDELFQPRTTDGGALTLLPCLAWLDSTHVVRTSHLIKFVFGRRGAPATSGVPIRKGDFPEDKLNQAQIKALKVEGVSAHARYGTWYCVADRLQVRHLSGRVFSESGTSGARARDILQYIEDRGDDDDESDDS